MFIECLAGGELQYQKKMALILNYPGASQRFPGEQEYMSQVRRPAKDDIYLKSPNNIAQMMIGGHFAEDPLVDSDFDEKINNAMRSLWGPLLSDTYGPVRTSL